MNKPHLENALNYANEHAKITDSIAEANQILYHGVLFGWDAAMKERDEEMMLFADWIGDEYKSTPTRNIWVHKYFERGVFTTSHLLEKFRSLPPSPPKE